MLRLNKPFIEALPIKFIKCDLSFQKYQKFLDPEI